MYNSEISFIISFYVFFHSANRDLKEKRLEVEWLNGEDGIENG